MRHSLSEYTLYFSLRALAGLLQILPLKTALFIARTAGLLGYWLDAKHAKVAYRNLRIAFANRFSPACLKSILKSNYQYLSMALVETLRIPKINADYVSRYIKIQGREYLEELRASQKGALLLGAHFGSWELCFATAGFCGYPFYMVVEAQSRNPLLNEFLNQNRCLFGNKVLAATEQFRELISVVRQGSILGMVADHGIKEGIFVNFFNRPVRTPTAAVRIARDFNLPILLVYFRRIKGPQHEMVVLPPFKIKKTANTQKDIANALEGINRKIEGFISESPEQYLWFYKRFKYSQSRNILLLHDGKPGHIRQVEAVLRLLQDEARKKGLEIKSKIIEVRFAKRLFSLAQALSVTTSARGACRGCLWCLRRFLPQRVLGELQSYFADIVISCGSSAAAVNAVISNENLAKSVVLMRPGILSTKRFDLVIMPAHDNPPKRKNILTTEGALNLINEDYLVSCAARLESKPFQCGFGTSFQTRIGTGNNLKPPKGLTLGLLLGGDAKRFKLSADLLKPLIGQIKLFLEKHNAEILLTTSRRTSRETEDLIKQEFAGYSRCRLLVIANEKNIPEAVGGILGLSDIVIVSPESISMISEAASSGKYAVVFQPAAFIGKRHSRFLENAADKKYIYLAEAAGLSAALDSIVTHKPEIVRLQDSLKVAEALGKLL